jgi:hypothetical protein
VFFVLYVLLCGFCGLRCVCVDMVCGWCVGVVCCGGVLLVGWWGWCFVVGFVGLVVFCCCVCGLCLLLLCFVFVCCVCVWFVFFGSGLFVVCWVLVFVLWVFCVVLSVVWFVGFVFCFCVC